MFNLVGRVVIYGFCLYGILRMFEDQHTSDAEERPSAQPQQSEQPLGIGASIAGVNAHLSHSA
jgi:hypothetical protein